MAWGREIFNIRAYIPFRTNSCEFELVIRLFEFPELNHMGKTASALKCKDMKPMMLQQIKGAFNPSDSRTDQQMLLGNLSSQL